MSAIVISFVQVCNHKILIVHPPPSRHNKHHKIDFQNACTGLMSNFGKRSYEVSVAG